MSAFILTADGPKEVETFVEPSSGLTVRRGTEDAKMVRDIPVEYPYAYLSGHTVLDLGAHVGGFAAHALKQGAANVVCVEASKFTFDLLARNVGDRCECIHAAVSDTPVVTLTAVGTGKKTGGTSALTTRRRGPAAVETVAGVALSTLIAAYKPSFIKLDIEGAEYSVLPCDLTGVEEMCGELHTSTLAARLQAFDLLKWFETYSFNILRLAGTGRGFRLMDINFHVSKRQFISKGGRSGHHLLLGK